MKKSLLKLIPLLLLSLSSCSAIEKELNHQNQSELQTKTLLVSIISNSDELTGSSSEGIFKKENFGKTSVNWDSREYSEKIIKENLSKYFKYTQLGSRFSEADKDLSFKDLIKNDNKFDYYLFLLPQDSKRKIDSSSSATKDFVNGCASIYCLAAIPIVYVADITYRGVNNFVHLFINDQNSRPFKDRNNFEFHLTRYPSKNGYMTQCLTSLDMALIKNNQKGFVAYKKISYAKYINIDNIDNKTFSSFDNFSEKQKRAIEQGCLEGLSQAIYKGFDAMKLLN